MPHWNKKRRANREAGPPKVAARQPGRYWEMGLKRSHKAAFKMPTTTNNGKPVAGANPPTHFTASVKGVPWIDVATPSRQRCVHTADVMAHYWVASLRQAPAWLAVFLFLAAKPHSRFDLGGGPGLGGAPRCLSRCFCQRCECSVRCG